MFKCFPDFECEKSWKQRYEDAKEFIRHLENINKHLMEDNKRLAEQLKLKRERIAFLEKQLREVDDSVEKRLVKVLAEALEKNGFLL
jgi:predicted  nucleic acid-binding Zn-ribbon protein